jgi:hypothetical protein
MQSPTSLDHWFPSLPAFEAAIRACPEVLGVLYTGSLGRGSFDRFSDLDIELWVPDPWLEDAPARLQWLMGWLGDVHFLYERGAGFATGFAGPDWRRVDLCLQRQADLQPGPEFAGARVVKDTDGVLAALVAASQPEAVTTTAEQARAMIEEAIDSQIYVALHNARGAVWSALGEVSYRATVLYGFLAELRGRRSYGLRYVTELLSPEEQAMLAAAWPAAATRDEVRRAARALWDWSRHVWSEAERALAGRLEIDIDEPGLLTAVDRIYGWE